MTRAQKYMYVKELYKQDKTIREIAQRVHMSPRDIGAITNKMKAEIDGESGKLEGKVDYDNKSKSKITHAIKLFSEGNTPIDVVIALDLPADEVRAVYREFLELKNMHKLFEVYDERKTISRHFWNYSD